MKGDKFHTKDNPCFRLDRRTILCGMAAAGATAAFSAAEAVSAPAKTLFGVNCYDLFNDYFLHPSASRDPALLLRTIAAQEIPFVRFAASPFWPKGWAVYEQNPTAAWKRLDLIIKAAERLQIKLVPTAIWNPAGLSDYLKEPASAWGKANSATRRFVEQYTRTLVGRYADSPAIMAWESSNELNSFADMPNSEKFWPKINVAAGTPAHRSAADRISSADVAQSYTAFAAVVRSLAPTSPISNGSSLPRNNHMNRLKGIWNADSADQFSQTLQLPLAGFADWLSIHIYPYSALGRFGNRGSPGYIDILKVARRVASAHKARLFVGEFGVQKSTNPAEDKAELKRLMNAIIQAGTDYAALWVYGFNFMPEWNVTPDNDRSWQLQMLRDANQFGRIE